MRNGAARSSATGTTLGQRTKAHAPAPLRRPPRRVRRLPSRTRAARGRRAEGAPRSSIASAAASRHEPAGELEPPRRAEDDQRGACGSDQRGNLGERLVRHGGVRKRKQCENPAMLSAAKRALVLAPHTDDGEFGCGGTMARLVEQGVEVRYVAFSIATKSLPEGFAPDTLAREVREATAELGIPDANLDVHDFEVRTFPVHRQDILELLIGLWEEWSPDIVFQPSLHDVHQDHQVIAAEGLRAFKRTTILGYEIPWNNFDFAYQAYVALDEPHVERKIAALAKYASQQHRRYADPEYIRNLARMHGVNVNREFAECFQVYRIVS